MTEKGIRILRVTVLAGERRAHSKLLPPAKRFKLNRFSVPTTRPEIHIALWHFLEYFFHSRFILARKSTINVLDQLCTLPKSRTTPDTCSTIRLLQPSGIAIVAQFCIAKISILLKHESTSTEGTYLPNPS